MATVLDQYNEWRKSQGLSPVRDLPTAKERKLVYSYSVTPTAHDGLAAIAAKFDFYWADEPSVSQLLEALGTGALVVRRPKQPKEATHGTGPETSST